jgi:hypothetical protein
MAACAEKEHMDHGNPMDQSKYLCFMTNTFYFRESDFDNMKKFDKSKFEDLKQKKTNHTLTETEKKQYDVLYDASVKLEKMDYLLQQLKEKQSLSPIQHDKLNVKLNELINKKNLRSIDVDEFNHISGLGVNFLYSCYGLKYYSIELNYDHSKKQCFFQASFKKFNSVKYDSDDEDEKDKMSSFHFVPFNVLYPIKNPDGTFKLTISMYFDYVINSLALHPDYHRYMQ